jgi:hypothetical protein
VGLMGFLTTLVDRGGQARFHFLAPVQLVPASALGFAGGGAARCSARRRSRPRRGRQSDDRPACKPEAWGQAASVRSGDRPARIRTRPQGSPVRPRPEKPRSPGVPPRGTSLQRCARSRLDVGRQSGMTPQVGLDTARGGDPLEQASSRCGSTSLA